ncbi:MAG: 50S ribosomal protein L9 [Gammaproteobacteria bacterium RIFCSPHIGHO2_12_FULL_40_19]|nr:MAG: 50S ribosomal protein L9 [Gammaproteobacteria bacterium RIFCSPHIGHO2_12_FULL_40_19]
MKVILQERVTNLGNVGDQVNVKAGYARNFLLPRNKAAQATASNIVAFEKRRVELEKLAAEVFAAAQQRAEVLEGHTVTLSVQASEEGKLFGSIGPRDIAKAVTDSGKALEKSEVEMPEGPIRAVGEHTITVHLHGEVHAKIKVVVNAG